MPAVQPNFLVVGAGHSGTSSMYAWLRRHPQVFMSRVKELNYFSQKPPTGEIWRLTWEGYLARFLEGQAKPIRGEASPGYFNASACRAIRTKLETPKILIMLRNPVDREFSLYRLLRTRGRDRSPTFDAFLQANLHRWIRSGKRARPLGGRVLSLNTFTEGVSAYLTTFGRPNVKIVLLEDIARDPAPSYREICQFLGIRTDFLPTFVDKNKAKAVAFAPLQCSLSRLYRACGFEPLHRMLRRMMHLNQRLGKSLMKLSSSLRAELLDEIRGDIGPLEGLLGRSLSYWFEDKTSTRSPTTAKD